MGLFLRRAIGLAGLVLLSATWAPVNAQTSIDTSAEARIEWAKRRVELVCRPLEAQGQKAEAAKCFQSVSLFIADPDRAIPQEDAVPLRRTAEPRLVQPPHRPVAVVKHAGTNRITTAARARTAILHRRHAIRTAAMKPEHRVVVASADQVSPIAVAIRDAAPSAKRCASVNCSRFMTMLGVGY